MKPIVGMVLLFLSTLSLHAQYTYSTPFNPQQVNQIPCNLYGSLGAPEYWEVASCGGGQGEIMVTATWSGGNAAQIYFAQFSPEPDPSIPLSSQQFIEVDLWPGQVAIIGHTTSGQYIYGDQPFESNGISDTFRVVEANGYLAVYANNVLVTAANAGQYADNAYSEFAVGGPLTSFSAGPVGPGPNVPSNISQSLFYNYVDLQWSAAVEQPNGIGMLEYQIYRNGSLLTTTSELSFSDTTVAPNTTYSYTLVALDQHFNSASTTFDVTTPPILPPQIQTNLPPSYGVEGRQVGVRSTGTYWGASPENIDMRTGNLNYAMPLLNAQGRNGTSVSFNLIYNSQNWRRDSGGIWQFSSDVGYGYGWRLMAGSITPVYAGSNIDHYLFTDSTGAEHRLDQRNGNIWSSKESIYVWYDSYASILHFRDGSFWNLLCVSAASEPDAGVMYPTLMEDSNGTKLS